jgi:hypothetical protein
VTALVVRGANGGREGDGGNWRANLIAMSGKGRLGKVDLLLGRTVCAIGELTGGRARAVQGDSHNRRQLWLVTVVRHGGKVALDVSGRQPWRTGLVDQGESQERRVCAKGRGLARWWRWVFR